MVTVLSSPQRLGTSGSALSGNSVRSRSSWPSLRRNALVVLDAELERHARGADIRGIGEDLRHREHAVLGVEVVDRVNLP